MVYRRLVAGSIIAAFGLFMGGGSWADAKPSHDGFETDGLDPAWKVSAVLSQGPGAAPEYRVSEGRLVWSYTGGTRNAQQQVLLREDIQPAVGEAVEVRLFPDEFPQGEQDFAGLALSSVGASLRDRSGLLLFFFEPSGRRLSFWHFGNGAETPSVAYSAALDIAKAKTLILRVVRIGQERFRASWSPDGYRFQWLATVGYGPLQAVGMYCGNARDPAGNSLSFDDFQVVECPTADRPEDYAATAPAWTSPDAFLAQEGTGGDLGWPPVRTEMRPGAYWWWPGSAVTKEDLTWNLKTYRRAGWGNMGVIGIYGVRGEEDRFIDIFSRKWFEMFNHAVAEAKRLGMNLDLTPSSGWRMGGPHVTAKYGEMTFAVENGRIVAKPLAAKVKRAGPGGEGLAINPYSRAAVAFHLDWMSRRFAEGQGASPRAFYYDSFENPGNWCPELLESFRRLRGYSLEDHAEALGGKGDPEEVRRVVCDYRETLSDVLIDRVRQIVCWGQERGSELRMQAHGAPANLLDMYAAAQIPETEVFGASKFEIPGFRRDRRWIRPDRQSDLVNRFASSAAHVAGRNLVISESFTWLRNHYHTTLAHIKAESDKLLLNGINGIYYHGICYAPKKTAWPGWLFYASTEGNARNSIFRDVPVLNAYITRCQSVLQEGSPHNDVLLYWPVYDLWMAGGTREQRFSVHHPQWIEEIACGEAARWMIDHGYTFDFVSDQQLRHVAVGGETLRTEGNSRYRTVLVPAATFVKVRTAERILDLARAGATILVWKHLPRDVPGWLDHATRRQRLAQLLSDVASAPKSAATVGGGRVIVADDLAVLLDGAGIAREPLVDHGLQFIRRKSSSRVSYFIVNHSANAVDAWVPIATRCRSVVFMDPMTGRTGIAPRRDGDQRAEVRLQLLPGETRILRVFPEPSTAGPAWPIVEPAGESIPVEGTWRVEFIEGGPVLPKPFSTGELKCWTQLGDEEAKRFAGAARYTIAVDLPEKGIGPVGAPVVGAKNASGRPGKLGLRRFSGNERPDGWFLDLGDVRESARVWVNGKPAGVVVAQPFRVDVSDALKPGRNEIAIEVTNLSANRIRDLDIRGVDWKKFYDINLVDQRYKPFDAASWGLEPSGLLGPVTLVPYRVRSETGGQNPQ